MKSYALHQPQLHLRLDLPTCVGLPPARLRRQHRSPPQPRLQLQSAVHVSLLVVSLSIYAHFSRNDRLASILHYLV